jgi:phospho-N-acetylmuramoyl-pentapeptide-transferase
MKEIHISNLIEIFSYTSLAFILAIVLFPRFIRLIKELKFTQKIRTKGLLGGAPLFSALHAHKSGTPTMGGAVIIFSILAVIGFSRVLSYFGVLDHSILNRGETYLPIATLLFVGILGLIDDYLNITEKTAQKGLSAKVKFWSLVGFAILGAIWFAFKLEWSIIHLPGIGDFDIGLWYAPLFIFVVVGTSNAVNISDGLDGLAGGLLAIAFGVFAVISYFYGLPILAVFCSIIVGTLVSFLWFNVPPAKIYMGDTGSLALGATLGVIAMLTNSVIILIIVCGVFIIETLSVILQLFWKKKFRKKLFKIAPIHHHFEAVGWSETQITTRFWIIGAGCGIFGLILGVLGMGNL